MHIESFNNFVLGQSSKVLQGQNLDRSHEANLAVLPSKIHFTLE